MSQQPSRVSFHETEYRDAQAGPSSWKAESLTLPLLETTAIGLFKRSFSQALPGALYDTSRSPEQAVDEIWSALPVLEGGALDVRPSIVERALEALAVEQATAAQELLERAFDIIIAHDDQGLCTEATFFNAFDLVIEAQSVSRAEETFSYLERCSGRIIKDMSPVRGKGPILLRACNELRRRLSKVTHLEFYGRIGLLLAASFSSGDRSSVNLKGEYNLDNITSFEPPPREPTPEPVVKQNLLRPKPDDGVMDVDALPSDDAEAAPEVVPKPVVESKTIPTEDFYATFWSLQRYFNNAPSLFSADLLDDVYIQAPEKTKASTPNLKALRYGLLKVLEVFTAATTREKAVAGAEAKGKGPAKVHQSAEEIKSEYFFPKYLTSRTLLDLQITDVHFRRQILVQAIITLQFLLGLTLLERDKLQQTALRITGKAVLSSSIRANMVLPEEDAKWVSELIAKCRSELRTTQPDGDSFLKTVQIILEREQNWVLWKISTLCRSFEQARTDKVLFEEAELAQERLQEPFKPYEHSLGTATLSRLWAVDTTLENFQKQSVTSFAQYHEQSKAVEKEIQARKDHLMRHGKVLPADLAADGELQYLLARKSSADWRGLRRALADQSGLAPVLSGQPTLDNVAEKIGTLHQKMAKRRAASATIKEETKEDDKPASSPPAVGQNHSVATTKPSDEDVSRDIAAADASLVAEGSQDEEMAVESVVVDGMVASEVAQDELPDQSRASDAEVDMDQDSAHTIPDSEADEESMTFDALPEDSTFLEMPVGTESQPIELASSQPLDSSDVVKIDEGVEETASANGFHVPPVAAIKRLRDDPDEERPSSKRAKSVETES